MVADSGGKKRIERRVKVKVTDELGELLSGPKSHVSE